LTNQRLGDAANTVTGQLSGVGTAVDTQISSFGRGADAADLYTAAIKRQIDALSTLAGMRGVGSGSSGSTYGSTQPAPLNESMITGYSPVQDQAAAASARQQRPGQEPSLD